MTDTSHHGDDGRAERPSADSDGMTDPDEMFPLTPPERRHDPAALADLPEHLRGPARTLLHESSWLERRIVADQTRLERIEDDTERTPWHQRARRAELAGRASSAEG